MMVRYRVKWTTAAAVALALTAATLHASPANASVELRGVVPTDYRFAVAWHPRERELIGRGTILVENLGPGIGREVWLRLRPNNHDRPMAITSLKHARITARRAGGSMLKLRLDRSVKVGGFYEFDVGFRTKVPRAQTSLGRSAGMDLFGDALPVLAVGGSNGVRVGPEPAYGEGSIHPVVNWGVDVEVPRGLRPILPGREVLVDRDARTTTIASDLMARDFAFAIGRYTSLSKRVDGVRLTVVGSSAKKRDLTSALRRTEDAFLKMQSWFGGYNLPGLKVVLGNLPFGGSEYPGLVFSTPDRATIAHEVAHQWFYGVVGNDQYNDPFLDESLTAFSEQRFHKSYRCDLARPIRGEHGLSTGMSYWENHPAAYENTIYRGGACALTVLQRDLGTDVFDRALRAYVAANSDKIADVSDFLAAIRTAAPWYDLTHWQKLVGLD